MFIKGSDGKLVMNGELYKGEPRPLSTAELKEWEKVLATAGDAVPGYPPEIPGPEFRTRPVETTDTIEVPAK